MPSLFTQPIPGLTRRRFLAGGLALTVGLPTYARAVEPGWLKVRRVRLPQTGPTQERPRRFAHLTK